jgi:hypothetical protein
MILKPIADRVSAATGERVRGWERIVRKFLAPTARPGPPTPPVFGRPFGLAALRSVSSKAEA